MTHLASYCTESSINCIFCRKIIEHDLKGKTLHRWQMKDRVNDLICAYDGQILICIVGDTWVELLRHEDHLPVSPYTNITYFCLVCPQSTRQANSDSEFDFNAISKTPQKLLICLYFKFSSKSIQNIRPVMS